MKSSRGLTIILLLTLFHIQVDGSICGYAERYNTYIDCIDNLKEQCHASCIQNDISCASCSMNVIQGIHCPANTYLLGGYCVPSVTSCPSGTVFVGGLCQNETQIECPKNYSYAVGVCLNDTVTEKCLSSVHNCSIPNTNCNTLSGNCRTRVECSLRQLLFNGGCVNSNVAICPFGFDVINGNCRCNSAKTCSLVTCPEASSFVGGRCVSDTKCPPNTISVNGVCAFCPLSSYNMGGKCVECPNGTNLYNGKCIPNQKCSNQEISINGKCIPLYCFGRRCCKTIECNFCFKYCHDYNIFTAQLSKCEERCINELPPIVIIQTQSSITQKPTTETPTTLSSVVPNITSPTVDNVTTDFPITENPATVSITTEEPDVEILTTEKEPEVSDETDDAIVPSITDDPITELPTSTNSTTDEPIIIFPDTEKPSLVSNITESPFDFPPIIEKPAIVPPIIEQPIAVPPIIEQPIVVPPIIEQPIVVPPIIEQPIFVPPIIEQPIFVPPIVDQPINDQTMCCAPPIIEKPSMPILSPPINEEISIDLTRPKVESNIPTKINITNIVNSTRIKNVLTNINSTNVNNIDLTAGSNVISQNQQSNDCCVIIEPKSCKKVNDKWKCYHRKIHTCGAQCTNFKCDGGSCTKPISKRSRVQPLPPPRYAPPQLVPQYIPQPIPQLFQRPYPVPIPPPMQRAMQVVQIPQLQNCVVQQQNRAFWICPPQQMGTVINRNNLCYSQNRWPFVQCIPNLRFDCSGCHMRQCNPICY